MIARRPSSPSVYRNRARLSLQALEARDVPASPPVLDLSFAGAQATANGAVLKQTTPVASSDFHTFLSIQHMGSEAGYNTDARPFQLDQLGDLTVTHSLKLVDVPVVNISGTDYRQFVLDVSELAKNPGITLDELRVYVAGAGNLTGYNNGSKSLSGLGAVWDLEGAGKVSVKLNGGLNTGTGKGDVFAYIPSALFGSSTYVYLYSKLGGKFKSDNGAESWGVLPIAPPPPTGSTLGGYVYFDANNNGIREPTGTQQDPVPETGLENVGVRLQGINDLNQLVDVTVFTDANGHYSFSGLRAGSYSVTKLADPAQFYDGINTPGVLGNGQVQESNSDPDVADMIFNISLGTNQTLSEYNFGELFAGNPN